MAHIVHGHHPTHQGFWKNWFAPVFTARGRHLRRAELDIQALPDYLKRDIGLIRDREPVAKGR